MTCTEEKLSRTQQPTTTHIQNPHIWQIYLQSCASSLAKSTATPTTSSWDTLPGPWSQKLPSEKKSKTGMYPTRTSTLRYLIQKTPISGLCLLFVPTIYISFINFFQGFVSPLKQSSNVRPHFKSNKKQKRAKQNSRKVTFVYLHIWLETKPRSFKTRFMNQALQDKCFAIHWS